MSDSAPKINSSEETKPIEPADGSNNSIGTMSTVDIDALSSTDLAAYDSLGSSENEKTAMFDESFSIDSSGLTESLDATETEDKWQQAQSDNATASEKRSETLALYDEFSEEEESEDDPMDAMYISKVPAEALSKDSIQHEVKKLNAQETYNAEGFKKSIFFERAISPEEAPKAKYQLPKEGDIVDNYVIEATLGAGGFGAVYRVKNLTLGRKEALKVILPSAKEDVKNIDQRFKREVNIVSRLEHPNVVRLYSFGTLPDNISTLPKGCMWMTMEIVKGITLEKLLEKKKLLPFLEAKAIMCQVLSGLQEAHKLQVIHRDLKPANIMITQKEGYVNLVTVLDFGLAKALGADEDSSMQELTRVDSRSVFGTPQYMAPEQLAVGIPGTWTDVYAAGLILVELITGRPPVDGEGPLEVCYRQIYEPLSLPSAWKGTAIEAIILKATHKSPANRYQNAHEFLEALERINSITDPVSVLSQADSGQNASPQNTSAFVNYSNIDQLVSDSKRNHPSNTAQIKKSHSLTWWLLVICAALFWILLCCIIVAFVFDFIEFVDYDF